MLRYYDGLGLVTPSSRTPAGYRDYSESDLWRLLRVEGLRALGLSLGEVAAALGNERGDGTPAQDGSGDEPERLVAELIARSRERLERERRLLERLERLDAAAPESWEEALEVVRIARGLESPNATARLRAALESGAGSGATASPGALAHAVLVERETNAAGALRWALARATEAPPAELVLALSDAEAARRRRAIGAIADFPGDDATALLLRALADAEAANRAEAALALGARGVQDAQAELVAMIVAGTRDVDAAETLGLLAAQPAAGAETSAATTAPFHASRILAALTAALDAPSAVPGSRARVAQALAELPPELTLPVLDRLAHDGDPAVARVARYLRTLT